MNYNVSLTLAKQNATISLKNKEAVVNHAIEEYNALPMQNPKHIIKVEISETYLRIRLESALPLSSPGKALRTFSKILLSDPDFSSQLTPNGQLFRTAEASETPPDQIDQKESVDADSITDIELVHSLIDYVFAKRDPDSTIYRTKKKAMQEIKKISLAAGLIRLK